LIFVNSTPYYLRFISIDVMSLTTTAEGGAVTKRPAGPVVVERPRSQSLPRSGPEPGTSGNGKSHHHLKQSSQRFGAKEHPDDAQGSPEKDSQELYLPKAGLLRSSEATSVQTSVPEEQRRFVAYKVESLIKEVLETKLFKVRYEPNTCSRLAQELCAAIKQKTKGLNLPRYKLVTHVLLGEDTDKSVQVAARCLWNQDTDNFAAATFRNNWIYAVAIVYGMYLE